MKKRKINFIQLKKEVLTWLHKQRISTAEFSMNSGADYSLYTSCFALFLYDLFGETSNFSPEDNQQWTAYINSYQDKETGYFIPEHHVGEYNSKPVHQLTAFCISALSILGEKPKYKLRFVEQWLNSDTLHGYLSDNGCFKGIGGSGNMAMFVGLFLTFVSEKEPEYKDRLTDWFLFHEKHQNAETGFWGPERSKKYYSGFQNAFHQFEVYNFWNRDIQYSEKIVDTVLSLQDSDGHFAPTPGGGGCFDYDAAAILIHCGITKSYKRDEVEESLKKLSYAILKNQNSDGGFCESRKRPSSVAEVVLPKTLKFIFSGSNPYVWYFRLRKTLSNSRESRAVINTHWTEKGRLWDQSDLWNTWFRCLTLAQIEVALNGERDDTRWTFQKCAGLGYFKVS